MADENYKKIKELTELSYKIETYQRGYRWDEDNVRELLEDIYESRMTADYDFGKNLEFDTILDDLKEKSKSRIDSNEYCLQPVVIKNINGSLNVIDGQQRLTTIYIILKVISDLGNSPFPSKFSIEYKSRPNSKEFLDNLRPGSQLADLDSAYMKQAYDYSYKWFESRYEELKSHLHPDERSHRDFR